MFRYVKYYILTIVVVKITFRLWCHVILLIATASILFPEDGSSSFLRSLFNELIFKLFMSGVFLSLNQYNFEKLWLGTVVCLYDIERRPCIVDS
jgi:hypothetical protein